MTKQIRFLEQQIYSHFLVENLNIPADTFDAVVSSAAQGFAKPKAQIYQVVLHQLQVEPHEAVFVDDNDRNIEGAQQVGLHVIRFRSSEQTIQALSEFISLP